MDVHDKVIIPGVITAIVGDMAHIDTTIGEIKQRLVVHTSVLWHKGSLPTKEQEDSIINPTPTPTSAPEPKLDDTSEGAI